MVLKDPLVTSSSDRAMHFSHGPMQAKDVPECAQLIAEHPVIGVRYGAAITRLQQVWHQLLARGAMRATVLRVSENGKRPVGFVGVTVFVTDEFVKELKAPPGFWIGPELTKRLSANDSPLLTDRQLREANSCGGLNLLVWEGCMRPEFESNTEIQRWVISAFVEVHRGFLFKEVISSQLESVQRLNWTLSTGGMLWDPRRKRYSKTSRKDPSEIIQKPHVVGMTRFLEEARGPWSGSWVGALFDHHPPRCGFSTREQKMLSMALTGETDDQLAKALGTSVPTVKKMWISIYHRTAESLPQLFKGFDQRRGDSAQRGKEKRRHLLAYLREHPEELRPVSQKLLRMSSQKLQ